MKKARARIKSNEKSENRDIGKRAEMRRAESRTLSVFYLYTYVVCTCSKYIIHAYVDHERIKRLRLRRFTFFMLL